MANINININQYPEDVKNILGNDILMREKTDPVQIAYNLAVEFHDDQKRKGIAKLDYITHPLRVYDLVSRCIGADIKIIDRDVTLAASLLHDGIEDYRKKDVKAGKITPQDAREEALARIKGAFPEAFAGKLLELVKYLTNPIAYTDSGGNAITKKEWQVARIKDAPTPAKLIKICDSILNVVANIEEVPDWNYQRIIEYTEKATAVVASARENIKKDEYIKYAPAIEHAARIYDKVSKESQNIFDNMVRDGKPIPPKHPVALLSIRTIEEMMRDNKNDKDLFR